jgi:hypothetical protein
MFSSNVKQRQPIYHGVVEVDGNYIDAEQMKNKSEGSIIKAYLTLWTRLTESGTVRPITHILDNKVSEAYKAEIKKIAQYR